MAIKVFNVMANLVSGNKVLEKDNSYIVVENEYPNIMQAMDIAQDIAEYNLGETYEYMRANGDYRLVIVPLDGGCGVPYAQFVDDNPLKEIANADDLYDFKFEYDELPYSAKEKARYDLDIKYHDNNWLEECLDSCKAVAKYVNADIDYDWYGYSDNITIKLICDNEDIYGMSGGRAIAWLENNIIFKECSRKHKGIVPRTWYSEVYVTGFCDDYVLHIAYRKFKDGMRTHKDHSWQRNDTIADFLSILEDEMMRAYNSEADFIGTDDWCRDICNYNDIYFNVDGKEI